jgi:hypothetical protein
MNFNVYLPDEIGQRAKSEDLKLSRMLRDAVTKELERRDAMNASLDEVTTYEVDVLVPASGAVYVGRITGRQIAGAWDTRIYLTADKRVLAYDAEEKRYERIDDPPEDLPKKLLEWLGDLYPDEVTDACEALGVRPVIDL